MDVATAGETPVRSGSVRSCSATGCNASARSRGMCSMHYQRAIRSGAISRLNRLLLPKICTVDGCEAHAHSAGLCGKHYSRRIRNGATDRVYGGPEGIEDQHHNWTGDGATYRAAHKRLTRRRGPASAHACVDCGQPAAHWAYDHTDPNELISPEGRPYSIDMDRYVPRCSSCHALFDRRHDTPA